jgi:molybdate transport system substrate-binding protein
VIRASPLGARVSPLAARALLGACAAVSACRTSDPADAVVLAAASLTEAFDELAAIYEREHPGAEVVLELAASSTLAAQVRAGAPFDILATADEPTMAQAWRAGLVQRPARFATNRLVLIVPFDDPVAVRRVEDLARPGVDVVLAQRDVPAGAYARRALEALGIAHAVEANVVSNPLDVRGVAAAVALGEADAGIVYASDVTPALRGRVRVLQLPEAAAVQPVYEIAAAASPEHPAGARAFLALARSETGRDVLAAHGLGPP